MDIEPTNEKKEMSDDDSDDDDLLNIDFPSLATQRLQDLPQKPSQGTRWGDDAILECMNLALAAHDKQEITDAADSWIPPPLTCEEGQILSSEWTAQPLLHLPLWAVDPFVLEPKTATSTFAATPATTTTIEKSENTHN
jgi:hypothetical protein